MMSFISITGIEKLDQLINNMKIKTLECLNTIYNYIFEEVPSPVKQQSPFLQKGLQLCPHLIKTLIVIGSRADLE